MSSKRIFVTIITDDFFVKWGEKMNKNDKRYIKNEKLIRETLIEMLRNMKYNQITVNAICEKALISKHTFYSHYESKEDLIKSLLDELFKGMMVSSNNYIRGLNISKGYNIDKNIIIQQMNFVGDYINKHFDIFYVFFKQDDTVYFSQRMAHYIKNCMLKNTNVTAQTNIKLFMMFDYIIHGNIGVTKSWVLNRDKMSLEELKKFSETVLISTNIEAAKMHFSMLKNNL